MFATSMNIFSANEEAVDLLLSGNNFEASIAFLEAATELRKEIETTGPATGGDRVLESIEELQDELFTIPIEMQLPTSSTNTKKDTHALEFFQSVFCLTPGSYWSSASKGVLTATGAMSLFNAGLAYHTEALRTGQSDLLKKALKAYTECSTVITTTEVATSLPLLTLAVYSNITYIHSELNINSTKAMNTIPSVVSRIFGSIISENQIGSQACTAMRRASAASALMHIPR